MEYNPILDSDMERESFGLNAESTLHIKETARWAKFLAIVGFVFIGLIIIASFFVGAIFNSSMQDLGAVSPEIGAVSGGLGIMMTVMYLGVALLYFFPTLFLYRFAVKTQEAIQTNNSVGLSEGFQNLKKMFRFVGIMTIVVLGLYAIALVFGILGGALMAI